MSQSVFVDHLKSEISKLREAGLYKPERIMTSPQSAEVETAGKPVINLCANNYLGLSNHPALVEAARAAIPKYGFALSTGRFICGTQNIHKELEAALSRFFGLDDTILYSSCFAAHGGVFEAL